MSGKYRQRISSLPLLIRKLVARRQAPPIYLGSRWAYSYNLANQIGGFSYDLNGNLISDGPLTYTYDAANRLRKVIRGAETLEYAYTGNGDRYAHTLTHGGESTSVNYLLDPSGALSRVLSETIDTPTADWTNTYLYGLGILGQQNGSTWSTFGTDPLGSVRFLLTNTGAIASRADYDPYGVPLPVPGQESGMDTTLGFTGEQTDPFGLVNLRARTYNPRWGAFTSVDPVEGILSRSASRNGYSYVEGNPANLVDPSGKIWWWLVAAGIGAFLGGFTYGAGSHLGRGGNFGDALGQGVLWGAGSAGVVGALGYLAPQTISGALLGAAGMLKGAIAPAAAWLAKSPVLKWGMIGAEAEWGRQTLEHLFPYDVGTSQFTNNVTWDALHPAQYDWWKIAKAGVLTAGGRLVLQWNGISGIPSPLMITKSPGSAALYGGILSAGAGIKAKIDDNIGRGRSGLEILGDMSFADISGNFLWGSLVSGLTTKYLGSVTGLDYPHAVNAWSYTVRSGFVMNFDEMVGGILPLFVNPITVTAGIGTIPATVSGIISKLEGEADMCSIERGLVGGALTNLTSFITSPWAYGVSNTWGSYSTNVAVNNCR